MFIYNESLIIREFKNNINNNKKIYFINLLLAFNFYDFLINLNLILIFFNNIIF